MQLVYDMQLRVISTICRDEAAIEKYCQEEGIESFRPVYNPKNEDYWSSVLIIILRLRHESSLTNPETAWIDEDDLFSDFENYIAPQDRDNSANTRKKMRSKLDGLIRSQFVKKRDAFQSTQFAATKWLVLRLTSKTIEAMNEQISVYLEDAKARAGEDSDEQNPQTPGLPGFTDA